MDDKHQSDKTASPLIDMLPQNVRKWKEVTAHLVEKYDALIPEEKEAFAQLDEYWKKHNFNAQKCEQLIELLAKGKKKHPTDRELLESLQDYRRLCKDYYTREKEIFEAFQKAMGGKSSKKTSTIPMSDPKQQQQSPPKQQQPQPQPKIHQAGTIYGDNRIIYPNGDLYVGEYRNKRPHGKGKMTWTNGNWQEGIFVDGELHDKQGSQYIAQYQRTDRGQFTRGERTGRGVMLWKSGERYEGEWNEDGMNGQGKYTEPNGSWSEGNFLNGNLHGQGKSYYPPNEITKTGKFQHGRLVGAVQYRWDWGDHFKGHVSTTDSAYVYGYYYYKNGGRAKGAFINGTWNKQTTWWERLGDWFWGNIWYLPWIIGILYFIVEWIASSGMFGGLFNGLFGGTIAFFVTCIIVYILEKVKNFINRMPRWLKMGILIVIGGIILFNNFVGIIGSITNFIKRKPASEQTETTVSTTFATVTANSLNLRAEPNTNGAVIKSLKRGDVVTVTGETINGWTPIEHQGAIGYVSESYITIISTSDTSSQPTQETSSKTPLQSQASAPDNAPASSTPVMDEVSVNIEILTKTFNPRLQARQNGTARNLYIDRVMIESGKFYIFFTGAASGDGGDIDYAPFWNDLNNIVLINKNNILQTWRPTDKGADENFTQVTTGFYLTFEGVTGERFVLKGDNNYFFETISLEL